jgi:hypothetical protein
LISKKSFPLKPLGQMNRNLVGRSSIKIAHFVAIYFQTWLPLPLFRGEDFIKLANQKQELHVAAMFANRSELNEQSL